MLSITEAKFVALSKAVREIKFIIQVLHSIGVQVKTPVIVCMDNVGAIFMAENVTTSQRTKHIDVCYHFVREYIQDRIIEIIFVKSVNNKANRFMKNVSGATYQNHSGDFIAMKEEMGIC